MKQGYYSLVLHAHLPYVRHNETGRMEERWLFEAITESYIPLLIELEEKQVEDAITISFSPPVMEMLSDPLMQERYLAYLKMTIQLLEKEIAEPKDDSERSLMIYYLNRYQKIKKIYLDLGKNILVGFQALKNAGMIRCITSSATHAFLPYLKTKAAIRSQVVEAIRCFEKHFGEKPKGFWLPECAIAPGIDRILVEEGIRYTFVDEHTVLTGDPAPSKGIGAPVYSPHGLILFPRHSVLSSQIWSSTTGYPGDVDYREFYRDIAYERDWEEIKPFLPEGIRIDSGIKHKRITGDSEHKEGYVPEWAMNKVHKQVDHFIESIHSETAKHGDQCFPPYLMVTPFDAELFGHWWFEGPAWIGQLLAKGQERIAFISPETYCERYFQDFETVHVSFSTWGRDGYGHVWINETNEELYRYHHRMEIDLATMVALYSEPSDEQKRVLKQMVREWMLAISSDWAFIIDGQTSVQYAKERFDTHMNRFYFLKEKLHSSVIDLRWLEEMENGFPFLADVNEQIFFSPHDAYILAKQEQITSNKRSILLLSWEYPPLVVGGLARHVYDLSQALVRLGHEVHIVTSSVEGLPDYELDHGVHVHRIQCLQPHTDIFFDWVGSLNFAMVHYVKKLTRKIQFDFIHAHDWLVGVAAKALKNQLNIPLLVTIHATEHGRNNGIHTDLQYEINQKEWELTHEADQIIVCSEYMREELQTVFSLSQEKITVIPNGVDMSMFLAPATHFVTTNQFTIFSVGRLVKEKGYQTLIEAAKQLKEKNVQLKFVVAGKGPMLEDYVQQINELDLISHIEFIGYISDEERNAWFRQCDATVFPSLYEPFGIVALESLAAGKATIVANTGGLASIIRHNENGVLFEPGNHDDLVKQVLYLYNHPILREGLATQGQRDVKSTFHWDAIASSTEVEMERCLAKQQA